MASSDSSTRLPGREVGLVSNYLKLKTDDKKVVYDFRVDFVPEVDGVGRRRELLARVADRLNGIYLFDGMFNLKSLSPIDINQQEIHVSVPGVVIKLEPGDDNDGGDGLPEQQIIFKRSEVAVDWGSLEMIRLYNMLMRSSMQKHLKWISIMRYFYDPATRTRLANYDVTLIRGFATAANEHKGGTFMACDSITKLLRSEHVHDAMKRIYKQTNGDSEKEMFKDKCRRELCGCIVITEYGSKQSYRIDDIAFDMNPKSTFERKGQEITFAKYFKDQYDYVIKDMGQPLLIKEPSQKTVRNMQSKGLTASRIYLIPELCILTGLSEQLRADHSLKTKLTQSTQLSPQDRYNQLRTFRQKLDHPGIQSDLNDWNLQYSPGPVHLKGRVLENERIQMRDQNNNLIPQQLHNPGDFAREIRGRAVASPSINWRNLTMVIHTSRQVNVDDFVKYLREAVQRFGLTEPRARRINLNDDRTSVLIQTLRDLKHESVDDMVLCIISATDKKQYDEIKKQCCIQTPCASQVVRMRTLSKKDTLRAIAANVCLQMACKTGSVPWSLAIHQKNIMVVGYDMYRDPEKRESAGGFVCTLNHDLTKYFSRTSYHKDWLSMSKNIASHLHDGLLKYQQVNGQFPDRVVVYRAGVGEGMIRHVGDTEVAFMVDEMKSTCPSATLAVVVVSKRINAKFFLKGKEAHIVSNPPPGTVVDTVVTRPDPVDEFYLVSQSVRHGTACPTNYNIIFNTTGWESPVFQTMAYKLCHLYYNWQGTVRVPAPCQYAHKLAFLTCTSLHQEPHETLSDRLFFL